MKFSFKAETTPEDHLACSIDMDCPPEFAVACIASIINKLDLDLLDVIIALSYSDIQ